MGYSKWHSNIGGEKGGEGTLALGGLVGDEGARYLDPWGWGEYACRSGVVKLGKVTWSIL